MSLNLIEIPDLVARKFDLIKRRIILDILYIIWDINIMTFTSIDELGKLVIGQSRLYDTLYNKNQKYFYRWYLIEIPQLIANEFDFKEEDSLMWRYYANVNVAVVSKRGGRISREIVKKWQKPSRVLSYLSIVELQITPVISFKS